jgi:hypothetical protein
MTNFDIRPIKELTAPGFRHDFITCEDELPAAVIVTPQGVLERATTFTEVKHETTDDK